MKRGKIRKVPRERQLQTVRIKQMVRRSLSMRKIPTKMVRAEMGFDCTFTVPWTILYFAAVKLFCGLNSMYCDLGKIFPSASKSNEKAC